MMSDQVFRLFVSRCQRRVSGISDLSIVAGPLMTLTTSVVSVTSEIIAEPLMTLTRQWYQRPLELLPGR